jgi:hypothetical protein
MYQWNNFLHQIEEQTLQGIFEGENDDLKISVNAPLFFGFFC